MSNFPVVPVNDNSLKINGNKYIWISENILAIVGYVDTGLGYYMPVVASANSIALSTIVSVGVYGSYSALFPIDQTYNNIYHTRLNAYSEPVEESKLNSDIPIYNSLDELLDAMEGILFNGLTIPVQWDFHGVTLEDSFTIYEIEE